MATNRQQRDDREKRVVSARKRVEEHQTGGGRGSVNLPKGVVFFQVKEAGSRRIDVIPYIVGKGNPFADEGEVHFERTYFAHRGVGPNNDSVVCLLRTFKKRCPICEFAAKERQKADADEDMIRSLAPKERQLWCVIDHANRDAGIQVWDQSFFLFGKFLDDKVKNADADDGYEFFADLEKGFTLKVGVTQERQGGYTFFKCADIEFKRRSEPLPESLLDEAPCLDSLLREMSYDEVKKMFLQSGEEDEDKDDEGDSTDVTNGGGNGRGSETERRRVPSSTSKAKAPKESPPEDEEDDDEQEVTEKSEATARNGKAASESYKVGDLVQYEDKECEVMKVSADGSTLNLEDEDGDLMRAIPAGNVTRVPTKGHEPEEVEPEEVAPPKAMPKTGKAKKK